MILDNGIKLGLYIFAAVCDGRIGSVQLDIFDAVCDAAEGKGLGHVGIDLAVFLQTVNERGKAEFLQIFIAQTGRDLRQELDGNDI